jgi:AcrR family transcriptional regulator
MSVAERICTSPREHVRNVALDLFVEQGFQAVSLRQLASAAGMQPGSLYNHFESKQALLFELIESYETELLQALPRSKSLDPDPHKTLGIFVRAFLHFTLRQAQRSRLTRMEFRCLEPEQQLYIQHLRTTCTQRLAAILDHGIERRVFKPVAVDTLVPCLLSLLNDAGNWFGPHVSMTAAVELNMKMIGGALLPSAGTPN